MADFNPLNGRVVLQSDGVFKPAELFEYRNQIFAKHGQGYIALKSNKSTSKDKIFWKDMELDVGTRAHIGNLMVDRSLKAVAAE